MDPVFAIALWALLFLGSHLVISSRAVRPRLIAVVGERAYPGIYSLVAFATFVPLVLVFAHHKHSGVMLWNPRDVPAVRFLVWLLMLFAFIIFIASFIAFSTFGIAHILMNGFVGDVIFFGTFPALSIIGGMHQDARKEAQLGAPYKSLVDSTSFFPGLALIQGRQHWTAADTPWIAIVIGILMTVAIVWLHPTIFGGNPLGM